MRPELTVESLGEIKITADEVMAIATAYDKLSERLMPEASVAVAEAAVGHPEAPGNIIGFGIGEKITKGQPTGRPAVTVLVREKADPDRLTEETVVPAMIEGVPTDVEETGEIVAYQFKDKHRPAPGGVSIQFKDRHRPAPGGVSISNCKENAAGTLGCWVHSEERPCILSNNHVMAMSNDGETRDPIAQRGRLDGGVCPDDAIANLLRFIKIDFSGGRNEVDAAIALAASKEVVDPRILRGKGKLDFDKLADPHVKARLRMKVQKGGRTTGWTHGAVDLVATTVNVGYGAHGVARFDNQFRVSARRDAFSQPGDSGSLVTTDPKNQPVGLLFAGGEAPNGLKVTFCNDIELVLTALNVRIYY